MSGQLRFLLGVCLVLHLLPAEQVRSQSNDFRVETDVFMGDEAKPLQQTLTIFYQGVAYDYSRDEPHRITMVDPAQNRIVMFDSRREVQTRVNMAHLQALIESARNQAANTGVAVALEDAKSVRFDEASQQIIVGAHVLRYQSSMQTPRDPEMAQAYAIFADTSAYINAWRAASPPPFARVALNAALLEKQALPEEIIRTTFVQTKNGEPEEVVVKCRLHANWRVSREDEQQVQSFGKMLVNYPLVSVDEFLEVKPEIRVGSSDDAALR